MKNFDMSFYLGKFQEEDNIAPIIAPASFTNFIDFEKEVEVNTDLELVQAQATLLTLANTAGALEGLSFTTEEEVSQANRLALIASHGLIDPEFTLENFQEKASKVADKLAAMIKRVFNAIVKFIKKLFNGNKKKAKKMEDLESHMDELEKLHKDIATTMRPKNPSFIVPAKMAGPLTVKSGVASEEDIANGMREMYNIRMESLVPMIHEHFPKVVLSKDAKERFLIATVVLDEMMPFVAEGSGNGKDTREVTTAFMPESVEHLVCSTNRITGQSKITTDWTAKGKAVDIEFPALSAISVKSLANLASTNYRMLSEQDLGPLEQVLECTHELITKNTNHTPDQAKFLAMSASSLSSLATNYLKYATNYTDSVATLATKAFQNLEKPENES